MKTPKAFWLNSQTHETFLAQAGEGKALRIKGFAPKESLQRVLFNGKHGAIQNSFLGTSVAIPPAGSSVPFVNPAVTAVAVTCLLPEQDGLSQSRALFYRGITPIPAAPLTQLPAPVSLGRTRSPKTHWERGKHSQGKELRLYLRGNLSWQRLPRGRKAARRRTMSLPVTFGKAARAPWALMDTRERCLMISLSCSTSTGLQPTTVFPPPRQRVGKAAAPAPALPAASPRRNFCPASVPATSQRNQPVSPAALLRTPNLSRRAGSSCKA